MPEGADRLKDAEESLRAAKILLEEGLYRDSVSRAYYAMHFAARVLLATKGLRPRTHGGVLQSLGKDFVVTGMLNRQATEDLGFAMQLRQRADYSEDFIVTEEDASATVRRADRFLEKIRSALEEGGGVK